MHAGPQVVNKCGEVEIRPRVRVRDFFSRVSCPLYLLPGIMGLAFILNDLCYCWNGGYRPHTWKVGNGHSPSSLIAWANGSHHFLLAGFLAQEKLREYHCVTVVTEPRPCVLSWHL